MTRQVLMRSPPVTQRQTYLFTRDPKTERKGKKLTAAECAAVCCCCPCSVMELLILGLHKVPTGVCRKVLRRRKRQRLIKKNQLGLLGQSKGGPTREELEAELDQIVGRGNRGGDDDQDGGFTRDVDMEKEMWDRVLEESFAERHVTCHVMRWNY